MQEHANTLRFGLQCALQSLAWTSRLDQAINSVKEGGGINDEANDCTAIFSADERSNAGVAENYTNEARRRRGVGRPFIGLHCIL